MPSWRAHYFPDHPEKARARLDAAGTAIVHVVQSHNAQSRSLGAALRQVPGKLPARAALTTLLTVAEEQVGPDFLESIAAVAPCLVFCVDGMSVVAIHGAVPTDVIVETLKGITP